MHGSKLPLTVWFWAAFLMTTHSNGISALQLQGQLGLGSYKTAWLLCAKLRRAMVDSDRSPLQGLVEVDETAISCRSKQEPVMGGQGRSHQGKLLVAGAVEVDQRGRPGRLRLARIEDYSAKSLHLFVERSLAPTTIARTDGWSGYHGVSNTIPGLNPTPYHRADGSTLRIALGAPGFFKPQNMGLGCLSRAAGQTSANLSR